MVQICKARDREIVKITRARDMAGTVGETCAVSDLSAFWAELYGLIKQGGPAAQGSHE